MFKDWTKTDALCAVLLGLLVASKVATFVITHKFPDVQPIFNLCVLWMVLIVSRQVDALSKYLSDRQGGAK